MKMRREPYVRPNFLGIGAAKCGTTWLAEVLARHPQVFMAAEKELVFFSSEKQFQLGLDWYLSHFARARDELAVGEFSVSYLSRSRKAAPRIHKFNPDIRFIAVFRNLVWRAHSHYRWLRQLGKCDEDFNAALSRYPAIIEDGLYYRNLQPFLDIFPREQFKFIKFEDLSSRSTETMREVLNFIGVDSNWKVPLINKKVGMTINPRSRVMENLRVALHRKARSSRLGFLISIVKRTGVSNIYRYLNDSRKPEAMLDESSFSSLIEKFSVDIDCLGQLTGLDLSDWLRYEKR